MTGKGIDDERKFDLQYRLIYVTVVAGKTFRFAEQVMERFTGMCREAKLMPFDYIRTNRDHNLLHDLVRCLRTGSYTRIEKCWAERLGVTPRELDGAIWEEYSGYKAKEESC